MNRTARSRLARLALWLVIVGAVLAPVAVLLTRLSVVGFQPGLLGVAVAMLLVAIGVLLALIGIVRALAGRPGAGTAIVAAVLGIAVLSYPAAVAIPGSALPPIHDITTDLDAPPQFVALVSARGAEANALDRAAPADLAAQQRAAYPHLTTLTVGDGIDAVFAAALAEAEALGWQVAAAVAPSNGEPGRIEATDTTLLFGFKDDVVIRIRDDGPGRTLVYVRSVSRVGVSDLGANAARIDAFLDGLEARL